VSEKEYTPTLADTSLPAWAIGLQERSGSLPLCEGVIHTVFGLIDLPAHFFIEVTRI
jgi:hypothetical protein